MNATVDYELLDFGNGRKLESLCGYVVDRPSPAAASMPIMLPRLWSKVDACFDEARRRWTFHAPWPADLTVRGEGFFLPLRATPFGHIGVFPEQRPHWRWLAQRVHELNSSVKALNLFAHTGGSTLAMASAGAHVVHVDAAKPNVVAAREAAQACGMNESPIRYIVDDALKFAAREVRREQVYNLCVLDPPAYGHSPEGKAWRIERDLWPLLDFVLDLYRPGPGAILFTGHTYGIENQSIGDYLKRSHRLRFAKDRMRFEFGRSQLNDRSGRRLDAGNFVRAFWT